MTKFVDVVLIKKIDAKEEAAARHVLFLLLLYLFRMYRSDPKKSPGVVTRPGVSTSQATTNTNV